MKLIAIKRKNAEIEQKRHQAFLEKVNKEKAAGTYVKPGEEDNDWGRGNKIADAKAERDKDNFRQNQNREARPAKKPEESDNTFARGNFTRGSKPAGVQAD